MAAVTLLSVLATQVHETAAGRLAAEIDAHWRGAYDILVRPRGAIAGVEQTGGLVEPNFVALDRSQGIAVEEWQAIRALPGVAVAAPVAWIGSMKSSTGTPTIEITKFPPQPTLYEARIRISVSDGLTDHLVYETRQHLLLGPAQAGSKGPLALSDGGDVLLGALDDGAPVADVGTAVAPPEVQSQILAVDPESERALLGESGAFLDPLIDLRDRDGLTTLTANPGMVVRGYNQRLDIAIMARRKISRPVIPVLVSRTTYTPVSLSLDIVAMGNPLTNVPDASLGPAAVTAALAEIGSRRTEIGSSNVEVSSSMRAFRLNGLAVPWPGTSLTDTGVGVQVRGAPAFTASVYGRPRYDVLHGPGGSSGPAFRVEPEGIVGPGGPTAATPSAPALVVGSEQAYRAVTELPIPIAPPGSGDLSFAPFILAPIAEYDLASIQLPKDPLDYVPLGAYDRPDTLLVADPNGQSVSPRPMSPTLNPSGLIGVPPMGIVDIAAAQLLRGSRPIDAIRVRVAGVGDYGPEGLKRITDVAASINAMGLDATVVAASSPQAVHLFVPDYDPSTTPPSDLGWVRQFWTTVGATPIVEGALSSVSVALLALSLLTVAVLIVGSELVAASGRRNEAAVLSAIGWRRVRVRRWQLSESLAAAVLVAVAGLLGFAISSGDPIGLAVTALASGLYILGGFVGAWVGMGTRRPPGRPASRPFGILGLPTSPLTMAARSIGTNKLRTAVTIIGVAVASASVALGIWQVASLASKVGPTLLAGALVSTLGPYQAAMLTLVVASSVSFTIIALRMDRNLRAREAAVLSAAGWRRRDVGGLFALGRIFVAVLAAMIASSIAALASAPLLGDPTSTAPNAGVAAVLALSVAIWGGLGGRPR